MAAEGTGNTTRNEENSKVTTTSERDTVKYLQRIINDHALTSNQLSIAGKKTIKKLFTKHYKGNGKEHLWLTNTFIKSYKHKTAMLNCILGISMNETKRPTANKPHDRTELTYERHISLL